MLSLRPYKPCDASAVVSWITDEVSFYQWSAGRFGPYPLTPKRLNDHYDSFADSDAFFVFSAYDETGTVGQVMMRFLDAQKTVLRFGFIIVDAKKRGKGYGARMLSLALDYAFSFLHVEKVTLGVFANNPAAEKCYRSLGFRDAGAPDHYPILGEEWLCLELEQTKADWRQSQSGGML